MTPSSLRRAAVLLALVALSACASSGSEPAPVPSAANAAAPPRTRHTRANEINAEQLAAAPEASAYALLQRLHPNWLTLGGSGSHERTGTNDTFVIYNDVPLGPAVALQRYRPAQLASIRFIPAAEAMTRYGSVGQNGVLLVVGR